MTILLILGGALVILAVVLVSAAVGTTASGQAVSGVPGVVTDITSSSFDLQDPARVGGTPFKQAIEAAVPHGRTAIPC